MAIHLVKVSRLIEPLKLFTQQNRCINNIYEAISGRISYPSTRIFCDGDLLHDAQMSELFHPKEFVDKKLKYGVKDVLEEYRQVQKKFAGQAPPSEVMREFIDLHLENNSGLKKWLPSDWKRYPKVIDRIQDKFYRQWALHLNNIWVHLGRKMTDDVKTNSDLYSHLYVDNGFFVRQETTTEMPYWDNYWIVKGLLACDMVESAKGIIENLVHLVRVYGHVPGETRLYYLGRSQPPMLIPIVESYLKKTKDFQFLSTIIDALDKEMMFWRTERNAEVTINKATYNMFRYNAGPGNPRPEAYTYDIFTGSLEYNEAEKKKRYIGIKSAIEAGWAFSTRWFNIQGENRGTMRNTMAQTIIPVDLNAIMFKCFKLLGTWYSALNNQKGKEYSLLAKYLLEAIHRVLWDEEEGVWYDYDMYTNKSRKYFYLSNLVPIWAQCDHLRPADMSLSVINYMRRYDFDSYTAGGIPCSMEYSSELWDFPNSMPPLQGFLIEGLDNIGTHECSNIAFIIADRWLKHVHEAYMVSGVLFEKYDAILKGETTDEVPGAEGFGWTLGLAFYILDRWRDNLQCYLPLNIYL